MNFKKLVTKRYSVRSYSKEPVEEDKLFYVLNAARLAPTAQNRQPFQILVVHTEGREEELLTIYQRDWFVQPPMIICLCGLATAAWKRRDGRQYIDVDVAIVMDHLVLAATDCGLGSCIVAAFDPVAARQALSLPEEVEPLLFTPLGYPTDKPGVKKRKSLEELVRYENW